VARELAARGLRVLAVSAKALGEGPRQGSSNATGAHGDDDRSPWADAFASGGVEEGGVLLALMALQDPLRVGVQSSVQQCQGAGIRIIMVTGDALPTAVAIARGCGILTSEGGNGPADRNEAVEVRSPAHSRRAGPAAQHKGALTPTEGAKPLFSTSRANRLGAGGATTSASSESAASSGDTQRHSPIRRGELSFAFSVNAPASDEGDGEGGRRAGGGQHGRGASSGARVLKADVGRSGAAGGSNDAGAEALLSSSGPLTGDSMAANNSRGNDDGGGSSVQQVGSAVVLEGPVFRRMSDDALQQRVLPTLAVLARAVPSDKLRLVQLLQGMGETVAVTGDGTNDAPALRAGEWALRAGCRRGAAGALGQSPELELAQRCQCRLTPSLSRSRTLPSLDRVHSVSPALFLARSTRRRGHGDRGH
jgi:magnesium-transporting ATPase (P-type)